MLVQALARLAGRGRDAHLLMIGDPLGSSDPTNREYLEGVRQQVAGSRPGRAGALDRLLRPAPGGRLAALPGRRAPSPSPKGPPCGAPASRPPGPTACRWSPPPGPDRRPGPQGQAPLPPSPLAIPRPWRRPWATSWTALPARQELARAGLRQARRTSWERVTGETLDLYRAALALTRSARGSPSAAPGRQRAGSRLSRVPHSAPSKTRVRGIRTR